MKKKLLQFLSSDLRTFVKLASVAFLGRTIITIIAMISGVVLARNMGPSVLGTFALVTASVGVIWDLFDSRTWELIIRYGSKYLDDNDQKSAGAVLKLGWTIDAIIALIFFIVIFAFAPLLSQLFIKVPSGETFIRILSITFLLSWGKGTRDAVLRMGRRYKIIVFRDTVVALCRLTAIIIFVILKPDLIWLFWGYVIASAIEAVLGWSFTLNIANKIFGNRWWTYSLSQLRGSRKEIVHFILCKNIGEIFRIVGRRGNMLIMGAFGTPEMAGNLKIITGVVSIMDFPISPLYSVSYPEVAKLWWNKSMDRLKDLIKKLTLFSATIGGIEFIIFLIFSNQIISIIYGPSYSLAAKVLPLFVLGYSIRLITIFFPAILSVGATPKLLLLMSIVTNGIFLIGLLLLTPTFKLWGVAYAELIMSIGVFCTLSLMTRITWSNRIA